MADAAPDAYQPGQRPLGSLQRRLQRSQASIPNDDDLDDSAWDDLPPARPSGRGSRPHGSGGPRRPSSGQGYGESGRRSRPMDEDGPTRGSRGGSGRSRTGQGRYDDRDDYNGYAGSYDESREEPAYSPYPPYHSDDDQSRERPAARRYGRADAHRNMEESAEMSAEGPAYGPPGRSAPRRRSRPIDNRNDYDDDFTNPLDDPRSPLRGSQSRRPSRGSNERAGGYPRYDEYGPAGYSEELPAPPARGSRGRGHAESYNLEDDFASRERWAAPDDGYAPYDTMSHDRAGGGRDFEPGFDRGFDRRADPGFDRGMEVWQPVGAPPRVMNGPASQSRSSRGGASGKPARKRKGGALRVAFGLLSMLALVAVVGVEFGPKLYQKYITHTGGSIGPSQTTTTCATESTPSAQTKPPTGSSAFSTTAYTLAYPTAWQMTSQSGPSAGQCDVVYLFSQPSGAAKFNVEEAGAFAAITDQQIIQAEAQSAQQQGTTFTEITSAATTQSIGGEVWQRREYQVTTSSKVKLHLAVLGGHHKGNGFAIVLISSDAGFSSDDTTTFEPMLHSLQFV